MFYKGRPTHRALVCMIGALKAVFLVSLSSIVQNQITHKSILILSFKLIFNMVFTYNYIIYLYISTLSFTSLILPILYGVFARPILNSVAT